MEQTQRLEFKRTVFLKEAEFNRIFSLLPGYVEVMGKVIILVK